MQLSDVEIFDEIGSDMVVRKSYEVVDSYRKRCRLVEKHNSNNILHVLNIGSKIIANKSKLLVVFFYEIVFGMVVGKSWVGFTASELNDVYS